ncbi:MAG: TonB-dependent receptor [Bdellovibrionales bacterium]|nr:TonB-dependent receptor [Massilia sp.]
MLPRSIALACLGAVLSMPALAGAAAVDAVDLADLSLEALANTRVTSVSKRAEPVSDAAASVYVISAESIRRAGATTLPEALRLAPNLQVARVDARNYAITARGFNTTLENKLLVLIDGRSVYSPLFSGVYWDAQDVVLADVTRIEVISGPGATLWGANAVNGVINIITKAASETQGVLAGVSGDAVHRVGVVRYGAKLASGGSYRLYAKSLLQENLERENGLPSLTGLKRSQAGFRTDWGNGGDMLTVQGDAYSGKLHQAGTADIAISGVNLLGRQTMRLDGGAEITAQAYWDFTTRDQPGAFREHLNTLDVQLQSAMTLGRGHRLVAGAGYRMAFDRIDNGSNFSFMPGDANLHWGNVFVHNETDLTDTVRLVAGAKLEHNNYTGLEFLPTLRLAWKPAPASMLWASASRTVRAPSRIDRDFYAPSKPALVAGVAQYAFGGGPNFQSEVAKVVELGYRMQPSPQSSISITAFASRYDQLRTLEPNPNGFGSVFANLGFGRTRGVEMWGDWQPLPSWRVGGGTVVQSVDTLTRAGSKDAIAGTGIATSDPHSYWKLRSSHDIGPGQSIDLVLRHFGKLERPVVAAYSALDLNYIWQMRPGLELSLMAQNLLDASHVEFGAPGVRTAYQRQLGLKLVWRP